MGMRQTMSHVINDLGIDAPSWMINMASEYATRHDMTEITLSEYGKTDEYQGQAECTTRSAQLIEDADIAANGAIDQPEKVGMTEPHHKGDLNQF
jgi:hypothetical protein